MEATIEDLRVERIDRHKRRWKTAPLDLGAMGNSRNVETCSRPIERLRDFASQTKLLEANIAGTAGRMTGRWLDERLCKNCRYGLPGGLVGQLLERRRRGHVRTERYPIYPIRQEFVLVCAATGKW